MVKLITINILCYSFSIISVIGANVIVFEYPRVSIEKQFPNILNNSDRVNIGYESLIEVAIFNSSYAINYEADYRFLMEDHFNGFNGHRLTINNGSLAFYHSKDSDFFSMVDKTNFICTSRINISNNNEMSASYFHLFTRTVQVVPVYFSNMISSISSFTGTQNFGPGGLLEYIISHRDQMRRLDIYPDGELKPNGSTDWVLLDYHGNFNSIKVKLDSSDRLVRMIFYYSHLFVTFNYIKFWTKPGNPNDPETVPYGYGCFSESGHPPKKIESRFTESKSFILNMEVAYLNGQKLLGQENVRIHRSDEMYAYENIFQHPKIRSIYDRQSALDYILNLDTGNCTIREMVDLVYSYIQWYFQGELFDILAPAKHNFHDFGTAELDSKLFNVYENALIHFQRSKTYQLMTKMFVITYFVPVKGEKSYPVKIFMKSDGFEPYKGENITEIRVEIKEFSESESLNDELIFETQNCTIEDGKSFSWFQIVFSDIPNFKFTPRVKEIFKRDFRKVVNFIPITRLFDIRVTKFGPIVYVTSKLFDEPNFLLAYRLHRLHINLVVNNETNILILENIEDCARSCSNNSSCEFFSYCPDRRCYLMDKDRKSEEKRIFLNQDDQDNSCNVYRVKSIGINDEDLFISSSLILSRIRSMVDLRRFELPSLRLKADEMFIVSNPHELGGSRVDYLTSRKLSNYKIILPGYKLVDNITTKRFNGIKYLDCLNHCENDDSCLTVSYCHDVRGECTISWKSELKVLVETNNFTSLSTKCQIMSKSFLDFFNQLPGRRLMNDSQIVSHSLHRLAGINRETCAKLCVDEKSYTCEAFDYCVDQSDQNPLVCFLHKFHIFDSLASTYSPQQYDKSWNYDKQCDHYTRKFSMEYNRRFGVKFGNSKIITTINGSSLENCASACNHQTSGECYTFEFCGSDSMNETISCRLSSDRLISNISTLDLNSFCSVYIMPIRKRHESQSLIYNVIEKGPSSFATVFCGLVAFAGGVVITVTITHHIMKKKS